MMDESRVHGALRRVVDPCSIATGVPIDVLDMGLVRGVELLPGQVRVKLRLTNPFCFQADLMCEAIREKVGEATGLPVEVQVDPADDWTPEMMAAGARSRLRELRPLPVRVLAEEPR